MLCGVGSTSLHASIKRFSYLVLPEYLVLTESRILILFKLELGGEEDIVLYINFHEEAQCNRVCCSS